MTYLVYSRVSERGSDWSGETSCEAQYQECIRYIQQTDPSAKFQELREEFISGTSLKKRKLAQALDDAEAGRATWDTLVALKVDRLFRSTEELLISFRRLSESGKGIILVRDHMDFSTIHGKFSLTVLAAAAELAAGLGKEATKDKMRHIARQGLWPGQCPFGYRRVAPKNNQLEILPDQADRVKAIYAAALAGQGPVRIAREMKMARNSVLNILANPFYAGRIRFLGIEADGKHEPIIDRATWERVQRTTPKPAPRPDRQAYPYLLTGLVRCGCGQAMSPATCRGKSGKPFPYYRCQAAGCRNEYRYVRADLLEQSIMGEISRVCYAEGELDALAEEVAHQHRAQVSSAMPAIMDILKARLAAQQEIDGLTASLAASRGGGLAGASRAILETLDKAQQRKDALDAEYETLRRQAEESIRLQDAEAIARQWRGVAGELANGKGDHRTRQDWVKAHINSVRAKGREFAVEIALVKGSTSGTLKHPQGAIIELLIPAPRRSAA